MIESVDAADWAVWAEENQAVLLDVRQPQEWGYGTLPGATLIPMTEIVERIEEIPRDRSILCVCRSGDRSGRVAAFLAANGFDHVANMAGGMKALGMQV
jgi:rhodanese-related sulfurtransferase